MSRSRSDLLTRLTALGLAVSNPATADNPLDPHQDLAAKLLRNGLAILCFSSLESFIRDRTNEILSSIDPTVVRLADKTDGIQTAAAMGALKAVNFRMNLEDQSSRNQFVIDHSKKIASLAATGFIISDLSFGHDKSNVSQEDVKKILEAFQIDSPWEKIKIVAGTLGYGAPISYEQEFRNIAQKRHDAAHNMTSQVTQTDILNATTSILAIAMSFDLIITECLRLIRARDHNYLQMGGARYRFNPTGLKICQMRPVARDRWSYYLPGKTRARKSSADREALFLDALHDTRPHGYAVVETSASRLPVRWSCGH